MNQVGSRFITHFDDSINRYHHSLSSLTENQNKTLRKLNWVDEMWTESGCVDEIWTERELLGGWWLLVALYSDLLHKKEANGPLLTSEGKEEEGWNLNGPLLGQRDSFLGCRTAVKADFLRCKGCSFGGIG